MSFFLVEVFYVCAVMSPNSKLRKLVSAHYCLRVLLSAQIVVRVFVVPANCCARVLLEPLLFPYSYN